MKSLNQLLWYSSSPASRLLVFSFLSSLASLACFNSSKGLIFILGLTYVLQKWPEEEEKEGSWSCSNGVYVDMMSCVWRIPFWTWMLFGAVVVVLVFKFVWFRSFAGFLWKARKELEVCKVGFCVWRILGKILIDSKFFVCFLFLIWRDSNLSFVFYF